LRKLPADFSVDGQKLPLAVGKVTFVRLVTAGGHIHILGQRFKVGKRLKFQYAIATIYTQRKTRKVYHKGRLLKEFAYKLTVE
jgi:putative transposase